VEPLAAAIAFRPIVAPARDYNEPRGGSTAPAVAPVVETVSSLLVAHLQRRTTLKLDARLALACAGLAEVARRGEPLSSELVAFALHAHGIVEPAAATLVARGDTAEDIVAALSPQLEPLHLPSNGQLGVGGLNPTVVIVARWLPLEAPDGERRLGGGPAAITIASSTTVGVY